MVKMKKKKKVCSFRQIYQQNAIATSIWKLDTSIAQSFGLKTWDLNNKNENISLDHLQIWHGFPKNLNFHESKKAKFWPGKILE